MAAMGRIPRILIGLAAAAALLLPLAGVAQELCAGAGHCPMPSPAAEAGCRTAGMSCCPAEAVPADLPPPVTEVRSLPLPRVTVAVDQGEAETPPPVAWLTSPIPLSSPRGPGLYTLFRALLI